MKYKLKTVRVYELEFETDGYRILADGLWARGLRKEALQPFCWEKDVAPSRELQNWFGYNPKRFLIFRELHYTSRNLIQIRMPMHFGKELKKC